MDPRGSSARGSTGARLLSVVQAEPYLIGEIEPYEEIVEEGVELDALVHHVNRFFQRMVDQSQQIPEELQVAAINTREPGRLADLLASSLPFTIEEKQSLLGEINVRTRLERLGQYLSRQLAVLELSTKIQEQVGSELALARAATISSDSSSRRSRRSWARAKGITPRSPSSGSGSRRRARPRRA